MGTVTAQSSGCRRMPLWTRDDIADLRQDRSGNLVTARVGQFDDFGTTVAELADQPLGHRCWDHRVLLTVGDHHHGSGEIGRGWFGVRHHGREEHRSPEETWPLEEHGGGDVGSVRESNGDQCALLDPVLGAGGYDKLGEVVGSTMEVILVKHAFVESTEEPRHAVLQHCPAYREHCRTGRQLVPQRQQVVLVSAGPVQQQQRRSGRGLVRPLKDVRSVETCFRAHGTSMSSWSGGREAAICWRFGSSHGGNLRLRPSSSSGSSTEKPGASVAISNNTPPGSRK